LAHHKERSVRDAARVTTAVAVSVVAAVAATVSFMHMHQLAERAGEGWRSWLVPLAVDGLVVAASMTMMARRRAGKNAGWLAWTSMSAGIAASLAANVAAAQPTLVGRAVAAWPPLALLLAYELLMDQIRISNDLDVRPTGTCDSDPAHNECVPATVPLAAVPVPAAEYAGNPAPPTNGRMPSDGTTGSGGTLAAPVGVINDGKKPAPPTLGQGRDGDRAEAIRQAARRFYQQRVADGRPCTGQQLAEAFHRSERWGRNQIVIARRNPGVNTAEPTLA
jgi:hypothetical protein